MLKDLTTYGRTKDEWQCENEISCWKWQHENSWIFHEDLQLPTIKTLEALACNGLDFTNWPLPLWNHVAAIEIFELPSNQLPYSAVAVGDSHHFVCALFPVPTPSNLWTKFQNPTLNRYKNSTSCQNLRLCSTKKKSAIFISIGFWPDARWRVHPRKAESSGPPCHPKGLWVLARCSYLKILRGCRCDPSARFVQGTSSRGGRVVGSWRICRCIDTGPRGQLILKYLDVVYESNPN